MSTGSKLLYYCVRCERMEDGHTATLDDDRQTPQISGTCFVVWLLLLLPEAGHRTALGPRSLPRLHRAHRS